MEHLSVDGYPVEVGARFWDNGLQVVEIEKVATNSNAYADSGCTQTWHQCSGGHGGVYDTLDGHLQRIGRLCRFYEGVDAVEFAPGTRWADVGKVR